MGLAVVEGRRGERGGVVAEGAIVAEVVLHVAGVRDRVVIAFVAGKAIRWQRGILAALVAAFASQSLMRPGERESGEVVVELRRLPGGLIVAH